MHKVCVNEKDELQEKESRLMLCFFISTSKDSFSLKHLDYRWSSYPKNYNVCQYSCISIDLIYNY